MAVTQISRIQHRRGLQQDLPQLASAELGWSIDQRRLFIGNGTLEEGAPTTGVTEILTQYSDITKLNQLYTFSGDASGYTSQTGPSALAPITRSYQQKFDDFVNIRDFGAVGDGLVDDTDAINRAIQQIYKSTVVTTEPRTRRTIYFPGGTYLTSNTIQIPPWARIVGDGLSSTIIRQSQGNRSVANVCDSKFQDGVLIGSSSATLPNNIEIYGFRFQNANASPTTPLMVLNSAANVKIHNTSFVGNSAVGTYANLIAITGATTRSIQFDGCKFLGGGNAVSIQNSSITNIKITNSVFDNLSNAAVNLGGSIGFASVNNFFGNVGSEIIRTGSTQDYSFGDTRYSNTVLKSGMFLGNLQQSTSQNYSLSITPIVLSLISNSSVTLDYEIYNSTDRRHGTIRFISNTTSTMWQDEYVETPAGVGANLFANNDSLIASISSGTATFQYNFKRFVNN